MEKRLIFITIMACLILFFLGYPAMGYSLPTDKVLLRISADAGITKNSSNRFLRWADQSSKGHHAPDTFKHMDGSYTLGKFCQPGYPHFFEGDIAEILVYHYEFSKDNRRSIENHSIDKYNIKVFHHATPS